MQFVRRKKTRPNIHLTALIDIVFLLLVFFLLASNFVDQQGIKISVPETVTEGSDLLPEIRIEIAENGVLQFNGVVVDEERLSFLLQRQVSQSVELNIAIKADQKAQYARIIHVIDIAKAAGVTQFLLLTQQVQHNP